MWRSAGPILATLVAALLLVVWSTNASADVFRPAYLQLTEMGDGRYDVLWKVPALDSETLLKVRPDFPAGTSDVGRHTSTFASGAVVQRWQIEVQGGLEGRAIAFRHLAGSHTDVLVRVVRKNGSEQIGRVMPVDPRYVLKGTPGPIEVMRAYALLGIQHILTGYDHLLFVLSLILIVRDLRRLLLTITAFTIAHSITLALATLGVIHVPGPPVEATIALSIVFVAVESLRSKDGQAGLAARKPWLVAFTFGLLHGLGFAGALAEVGLPADSIPLALLFFNVGVEIGQLIFIAGVILAIRLLRRLLVNGATLSAGETLACYGIGITSSFWLFERLAAF